MKSFKLKQDIKVAVDAVVFGYNKEEGISVLLIKRKIEPFLKSWALPGGFVKNEESLEEAVERELHEEAGIRINYLEQLFTFGDPGRDPRSRVLSVAYFGLVRSSKFKLLASTDALEASWFNINDLPKLAFDHKKIIDTAIQRLRAKITYAPIGFELLDNKFLFSDLEQLYIQLLGKEIDRRNFKRKVMSLGLVAELNEIAPVASAGRPPKFYAFDKTKYKQLQHKGFNLDTIL